MQILVADDQAQVRSALRLLLENERGWTITGEVEDRAGLLAWLRGDCADLLLLDWELPGLQAADLTQEIKRLRPHLQVVALSSQPGAQKQALAAGADAFICKGDPAEKLLAVLPTAWPGHRPWNERDPGKE